MKKLNEIIKKINISKNKNYVQDIYIISNVLESFFVHDGYAIKILEIIPVNISDLNEDKKNNIILAFKEMLKECNFRFKIISEIYRLDIEQSIDEMRQEKIEINKEILSNYEMFLREISAKKEMYINRYYIVFRGLPVDNVNNIADILKDIEDRCEIFFKLSKIGVKINNINSKDEIIRILKAQIYKGSDLNWD